MVTQIQNFYIAKITRNWSATTGDFNVSVKPTTTSGWITVSPNNSTLREIVKFSATGTNTYGDFITISNISDRGVGGTNAQTHTIGEEARMNITAEHWKELNDNAVAPNITIGTVTGGPTAIVTNSGTPVNAVFNFTLPKGDQGNPGTPGTNGTNGTGATVVTTISSPGSDLNVPSEKALRTELDGKQPVGSYATSTQGTKADNALPKTGGTMTGKETLAGHDEVAKTYTPATGSQTVVLDCSVNNIHVVSGHASGTAITFTIANATNSQPFIVSILQGGTTVSTISGWFATIRWAGGSVPILTATLNKRDTFGFIRTGANTYDGFIIGQNC